MLEGYVSDKLTVPLLDKDHCLPHIPPPTDADYHVKKPAEGQFLSCCNNFWWCLQNVAKGIWRDVLPYAKQMFEKPVRSELDQMVSWWIGSGQDFQISAGKMGKYYKKYLPEAYWNMYEATYSDGRYEKMWATIDVACELFRALARDLARKLAYAYREDDDAHMSAYLKHVRELPGDAKGIYE